MIPVLRSDLLHTAREVLHRLAYSVRESEDAPLYLDIYDSWTERLHVAERREADYVVPSAIAQAAQDLIRRAADAAETSTEDVIAEWLDLLPRSVLGLVTVSPSVQASVREVKRAYPRAHNVHICRTCREG